MSAFSPICNPTQCPWGEKAFKGYLGSVKAGEAYDATELISNYEGPKAPILIDQVLGKIYSIYVTFTTILICLLIVPFFFLCHK